MNFISFIVLVIVFDYRISCFGNQLYGACKSQQYLEFGKPGKINCIFDEDIIGVLWYNTTNYENHDPIVDYQYQVKTGAGYVSGEFDVDRNGSLIINNVSLQHDKAFHVAAVLLEEGPQSIGDITIIVFMKPLTDFPLINKCGNTSNVCYSNVYDPLINCSVNSRPSIPLSLKVRTVAGDKNISTDVSVKSDEQRFTSIVSTRDVFQYTSLLSLLVCQASSPPEVLKNNESQILVQNRRFDIGVKLQQAGRYYADRSKTMELPCVDNAARWLVWKRVLLADAEHEVLMYSVSTIQHVSENYATDAVMGTNGSFVVPLMDVSHEGLYYCIYGDGKTDGVTAYNVSVVVHPLPAYPVIEVCGRKPPCQFKAKREGNLTCTLKNVRPLVQLEWKTLNENDSGFISFENPNQTNKDNGETFDVTLTTMYSLRNLSLDQLTLQCTVLDSSEVHLGLMSTLELSFEKDFNNGAENGNQVEAPSKHRMIIIVAILAFTVLVVGAVFIIAVAVKRKRIGNRNRSSSPTTPQNIEEEIPFVSPVTSNPTLDLKAASPDDASVIDLDERRISLIDELRIKYRELYNAVQPIALPSYQGHRSVNDIFVESGIQVLKSIEGGREEWQNLNSCVDIFNVFDEDCNRTILEGDVGYGKSTLTLQIAYDWCHNKANPILRDAEILILLRLRQTGGVFSIYKSVKCFLLPDSCDIEEREIEKVLKNTKSVLLILDGYDEYPDRNEPNSDMMKIFNREMFPLFKVILTTRSSVLLPKLPPLTTRVRLGGFTENVQKTYIRNVVVNGNYEAAEKLEKRLHYNPLVRKLCETPSFFVMFAHLLHETDNKVKINSVTSVMWYATTWLQHHVDVKFADDKAVLKCNFSDDDRQKIGKVAFNFLCGNLWTKEELYEHLGTDLFNTLIQTGILVEEEKLGNVNASFSEPFEIKIEVRFYNKVFCEWYAAYFLARKGTNYFSNKFEYTVKKMNRLDLQYLYRFACGIDPLISAGKIIKRLKQIDGGNILALLCRIESNENFETVKDVIRQSCSEGIIISGHDSILLQRSCIQLLEIAARNNIPIAYVNLYNSFERVDLSTKNIVTTSGLVLSSTIPFKKLMVSCNNRKMDEDKFTNILEFSSKCQTLRVLRFFGSVPPRSFEVTSTLSTLDSKGGVKVHWRLLEYEPPFILNLKTGKWEREKDGKIPTSEDFKKMRKLFAEHLEDWSDDDGVEDVKDSRKRIRKIAERRRNPQSPKKRTKKLRKDI